MLAKYFLDRLIGYDDESKDTGKYYRGYSKRGVDIHRKGNESVWYTLFSDGSVLQNGGALNNKKLTYKELEGDDFELFNTVKVVKSGYLVLDTNNEIEVMRIISRLCNYIDSLYNIFKSEGIPTICGLSPWQNGLTDGFSYYAVNDYVVLKVETVKSSCKENVYRKYYDARCLPFIKSMKNENSIYVSFIVDMEGKDIKEVLKDCRVSLNELFSYLKEISVEARWVECKMKYPVYY